MKKLMAILAILGLTVLVAAGCSSDDEGSSEDKETTTTTEAAEDATEETTPDEDPAEDREPTNHSEDELAAALAANLSTGNAEEGDLVLEDDQAVCVGEAWLEVIGADAINATGATLEEIGTPTYGSGDLELTVEQGEAMVDAFGACDVDIVGLMAQSLSTGLTEEQVGCIEENMDADQAEALLAKTFANQDADEEFQALITALATACDLPM